MSERVNRRWVLARRPVGTPGEADFRLEDAPVPTPGDGELLLRHECLGLAPAARIRMGADPHYAAQTAIGEVIYGQALATIAVSNHPDYRPGERVVSMTGGWQEWSLSGGTGLARVPAGAARPTLYLGMLGSSGFTAFIGMRDVLGVAAGETVVVSGAAGAVGSVAVQIGRFTGCRIVGVASGAAKCAMVVDRLGAAACVDRTAGDFAARLAAACSDGVHAYFDNSGGAVRDAVWPLLRDFGHVAVCGQIAAYNDEGIDAGPGWMAVLTRRLTIKGFLLRDHYEREAAFHAEAEHWAASLVAEEHEWTGLESTPRAFAAMLAGETAGKTIVRLTAG